MKKKPHNKSETWEKELSRSAHISQNNFSNIVRMSKTFNKKKDDKFEKLILPIPMFPHHPRF
jgi:hypothetical protein